MDIEVGDDSNPNGSKRKALIEWHPIIKFDHSSFLPWRRSFWLESHWLQSQPIFFLVIFVFLSPFMGSAWSQPITMVDSISVGGCVLSFQNPEDLMWWRSVLLVIKWCFWNGWSPWRMNKLSLEMGNFMWMARKWMNPMSVFHVTGIFPLDGLKRVVFMW